MTLKQALELAFQNQRAGRLEEAEQIYRHILARQPNNADALNNLGLLAHKVNRNDVAVDLIRQAIALRPCYFDAHYNLGDALSAIGRLDEAIVAYRQAIAIKPDFPAACSNLGVTLQEKGQLDEAIAAYRQAIDLQPNFPEAFSNLGAALKDKGQLDEAIVAFQHAVTLAPGSPDVVNNFGLALGEKGRLDEAIAAHRQAIALNPQHAEAHLNLANTLKDRGQLDEAIVAYRQAISLQPQHAGAYFNLGIALREKGQLDEAIAAYRQAIVIKPGYHEACNNLGSALKDKGQLDEAIAAYRQAIVLQPNQPDALSNLIFTLHFHPGYDTRAIAFEHRNWIRQHGASLGHPFQTHDNDPSPNRRLRIGYVSPDLWEHPVGRFLAPLLAHHSKSEFEIYAYADVRSEDKMTQSLRSCADCWRRIIGLSDAQVAKLARQDKVDILVDLAMHTSGGRLRVFALKPAPVQVTYLAYCSSTGLETIDYRLSDPYLDPPGNEQQFYSEKTIRLPETYWCYQPGADLPEVNPLPCLERGFITFGSLNNFCKVSGRALAVWAKLLHISRNSRLLIHSDEGSHRQRLRERLEQDGIEPQRVQFAGKLPARDYFGLYHGIDIALDTFPYAGGTTTCDALWMGVPVVSLSGETAVGRGGVSILSNIGLPELAALSTDEYVKIAGELADDLPRLSSLRSTLRNRMRRSVLMDASGFTRKVEQAYRKMWHAWCAKQSALL